MQCVISDRALITASRTAAAAAREPIITQNTVYTRAGALGHRVSVSSFASVVCWHVLARGVASRARTSLFARSGGDGGAALHGGLRL